MAITIDDFKKNGCLRPFVTKIGLLDKIDKSDIDQTILLSRLVKDIMPINVIEDPEGKIASFDENNPDPSVFDTMEINPIIKPEPGPTPTYDNAFITSDGKTFMTSDGSVFIVLE